jgi:calcineurin-like phosphoesterase family protein
MTIWFTADTHFGHERTLQLSRRPFDNVEAMNLALVHNWNAVVSDEEKVYHLGDFGDPKWIKLLRGKVIYILPGNYETAPLLMELKKDPRVRFIEPRTILQTRDGPQFTLVHEPETATYANYFHLFGHIHKLQMVKRNGLNVGTDCHDFAPIDLETVLFYYNAITKHYDENVFMRALGVVGE